MVGGLNNGLTVYTEPYDQLDLNVAYNLTPDWTLTASVINATKSEQRVHLGSDTKARLISNTYAGRQLYFGATGSSKATPGCPGAPGATHAPPWRGRSSTAAALVQAAAVFAALPVVQPGT